MDPASILKLIIVSSVVLIVVSIGMNVRPGTALAFLKSPIPVSKAMLAMFVAMPLFTLLITWWLPLENSARIALLALSVSPMPPLLPRKEVKLGADMEYAIGIQVAAMITALVAAPLFVWIFGQVFGRQIAFEAGPMLQVLLLTIGAPLAVGVLIKRYAPDFAAKWRDLLGKAATITLALGALVMIVAAWPSIRAAVGNGTLVAIALMTLFGLAVGHWLGGPDKDNRNALAVATASRHPGVAIGLASMADPVSMQAVVGAILLYLVAGAVFGLPYSRWAKG
jgi:bile acid:Na+ symporter, BASS family